MNYMIIIESNQIIPNTNSLVAVLDHIGMTIHQVGEKMNGITIVRIVYLDINLVKLMKLTDKETNHET